MQSFEGTKERIRVAIEKLKIVSTVVILITSGLIGLLFKNPEGSIKFMLFSAGVIADIVAVIYLWKLNDEIKRSLNFLEVKNV